MTLTPLEVELLYVAEEAVELLNTYREDERHREAKILVASWERVIAKAKGPT